MDGLQRIPLRDKRAETWGQFPTNDTRRYVLPGSADNPKHMQFNKSGSPESSDARRQLERQWLTTEEQTTVREGITKGQTYFGTSHRITEQ